MVGSLKQNKTDTNYTMIIRENNSICNKYINEYTLSSMLVKTHVKYIALKLHGIIQNKLCKI